MPFRWQDIIWTKDGLAYWCIYASVGLNDLTIVDQDNSTTEISLPYHIQP